MKDWISEFTDQYHEDPKLLQEFLEFGSRFYTYSVRNTQLIFHQNPHATFVQSFPAWKKMDTSILKGQKGIKVFVPQMVTILETEPPVQLKEASKEQRDAYKKGILKGKQILRYGIGNVFDISQTTFPKERYPELLSVGTESKTHNTWIRLIQNYAVNELECSVKEADMQSISLRGSYRSKEITINRLLNDTENLSTLTHELGHHLTVKPGISLVEAELKADMVSMMLFRYFGLELTDSRSRHFVQHFRLLEKDKGEKAKKVISNMVEEVFEIFKETCMKLKQYDNQKIREEGKEIIDGKPLGKGI